MVIIFYVNWMTLEIIITITMISSTQVLVIGGGDGAFVKNLLEHPDVESIIVIEADEVS